MLNFFNTAQAAVPLPTFTSATNLPAFISSVYSFAITIVGIAIFIQILRAGFLWLTAAGNVSKASRGRTMITNAVIGAILLFASYLILYIINPDLVKNSFNFNIPPTGPISSAPKQTKPTNGSSSVSGVPQSGPTALGGGIKIARADTGYSFAMYAEDSEGNACSQLFNMELALATPTPVPASSPTPVPKTPVKPGSVSGPAVAPSPLSFDITPIFKDGIPADSFMVGAIYNSIEVYPGDTLHYRWDAGPDASKVESWYTLDSPDTCGNSTTGPYPWDARTNAGTSSAVIQGCQAGHTYTIYVKANYPNRPAPVTVSHLVKILNYNQSIRGNIFVLSVSPASAAVAPGGSASFHVTARSIIPLGDKKYSEQSFAWLEMGAPQGFTLGGKVDRVTMFEASLRGFDPQVSIDKNTAPGVYTVRFVVRTIGAGRDRPVEITIPFTVTSPESSGAGQPTLSITPQDKSTSKGIIAGFDAMYDPDGSGPQPAVAVTQQATWSSSNKAVADTTYNPLVLYNSTSGYFEPKALGTTTVAAAYNGLTATATLNVVAAPSPYDPKLTFVVNGGAYTTADLNGVTFGEKQLTFGWMTYGADKIESTYTADSPDNCPNGFTQAGEVKPWSATSLNGSKTEYVEQDCRGGHRYTYTITVTQTSTGKTVTKSVYVDVIAKKASSLTPDFPKNSLRWINGVRADTVDCSSVRISTQSIPYAYVGQPYFAEIGASGGTPPYVYSVMDPVTGASAPLPPGLYLQATDDMPNFSIKNAAGTPSVSFGDTERLTREVTKAASDETVYLKRFKDGKLWNDPDRKADADGWVNVGSTDSDGGWSEQSAFTPDMDGTWNEFVMVNGAASKVWHYQVGAGAK